MLNIVVPMAGRGSRFRDVGYALPKPLIPVHGVPMIKLVIDNIRPSRPHRFVFICLAEHLAEFALCEELSGWAPGCEVVTVDRVTEGAACTVLLARKFIDADAPLMLANSDQWVDVRIDDYLAAMDRAGADGFIMTMKASDNKWSFVRFDAAGRAIEVVEKEVVSDEATVGIYNYRRGADFVAGADAMIRKNMRVNGEFYVAPVYNELVAMGQSLGVFNIGTVGAGMYGLGTPSDLDDFLSRDVSRRAAMGRPG